MNEFSEVKLSSDRNSLQDTETDESENLLKQTPLSLKRDRKVKK